MPDALLSTDDYAEARAAFEETFTDAFVVEASADVFDANGVTPSWSAGATGLCLVIDLSGQERVQADRMGLEVSSKVRLPALTAVVPKNRIQVTHWETGAVRIFQVEYIPKPSREFFRDCWAKEFS